MIDHSRLSRRALLLGLGVVGAASLSSCAALSDSELRTEAPPTSTPPPAVPTPPPPRPTTTARAMPRPAVIDPADVAARYAQSRPTSFGLDLPGIRQTLFAQPDGPTVALTFDACGGRRGSRVDQRLIDTLRSERVPATLFLNSRWIEANPQTTADLAADPLFRIGNHGTQHVPLTVDGRAAYGMPGTTSAADAVAEVWTNGEGLAALIGSPPRLFRPGTAHYDDVGLRIAGDLGVEAIGFSVNGDGGATFSPRVVRDTIGSAAAGSIVIAHMNHPEGGTAEGVAGAIADLRNRGIGFAHVDTLSFGATTGTAVPGRT